MAVAHKTGKTYRLLSEAEREYVTRAGTTTPFWWGSTISTSQANYKQNLPSILGLPAPEDGSKTYGRGLKGEYRQKTVPVDSFQPNPWGLYQVHGNVLEWTEDCDGGNDVGYRGAPTDGSARTAGDCSTRAVRGGSWSFGPRMLRSAYRLAWPTTLRDDGTGFRVARTLVTP
jgi:formylglycine-generating enzyme required for sulfatase activity